ncbi:hypothetical protein CMT52_21095 [Elizabethkingia anophelis]|nr:hypothetical protein [Elizabethkingia anophelis]
MIAIKTKKQINFPPSYTGFVKMEMDLIQNIPGEQQYNLRIIDTCYIEEEIEVPVFNEGETTMEKKIVQKQLGQSVTRFKVMTYDELDQLAKLLPVDMTDKTKLRENINELFRQGLLFITQQECRNNQGQYFTKAEDWEIIRD